MVYLIGGFCIGVMLRPYIDKVIEKIIWQK